MNFIVSLNYELDASTLGKLKIDLINIQSNNNLYIDDFIHESYYVVIVSLMIFSPNVESTHSLSCLKNL